MQFLQHIPWYLEVAAVFIVMMTVLVAAHEYGHYLFARMFGMGIEEFAIGMGKLVKVWRRKTYPIASAMPNDSVPVEMEESKPTFRTTETTEFTFRAFPVGGFVRIKGMMPEDDGSEIHIPGGFYSKAPWKRFLVLLAGPLFSVVAGLAILVPVYSIWGKDSPDKRAVIGYLTTDMPAAQAGLQKNDVIKAIDGKPIGRYYEMIQVVSKSPGKQLTFSLDRGGKLLEFKVTPKLIKDAPVLGEDFQPTSEHADQGKIGAGFSWKREHLSLAEAWTESISYPVKAVTGVYSMFVHPSTFKDNVGGPATMVDVVARSTEQGIDYLLGVAALLSISVGIMNLLPIPPLDGGQMMVALAEMLRGGRRLSMRVQVAVQNIGFTLVAMLILSVLFVDFQRYALPEKPSAVTPSSSAAASPSPSSK